MFYVMSCPTNEPLRDFFAFHALKITKNIRNSLIFLRKMATFSCFAVPIVIKMYASIHFMTICPLAHIIYCDLNPWNSVVFLQELLKIDVIHYFTPNSVLQFLFVRNLFIFSAFNVQKWRTLTSLFCFMF